MNEKTPEPYGPVSPWILNVIAFVDIFLFSILTVACVIAATVLCIKYKGTRYLYTTIACWGCLLVAFAIRLAMVQR